MKLTNNHYAFLSAAGCGFFVWYFSKEITGHTEPWDGNIVAYLSMLIVAGFICTYIFKCNLKWVYWGGFAGQAMFGGIPFFGCMIFGYFCEGGANLFPIGAIFLLIYSLPILIGAALASKIPS